MTVRVLRGDCREVLRGLPDRSVHCVVTSPPYWGLRDYGTAQWDGGDAECDHVAGPERRDKGRPATLVPRGKGGALIPSGNSTPVGSKQYRDVCGKCGARRVDRQIGIEHDFRSYVAEMVEVFREVRRVLRDDGTVWLNLGDSYSAHPGQRKTTDKIGRKQETNGGSNTTGSRVAVGLKPKDLVGIPWRVAFALQEDGWWLRAENIWAKRNSMPESVRDRTTRAHETVFMLTKSDRYFYDATAIEEEGEIPAGTQGAKGSVARGTQANGRPPKYWEYTGTRNKRSVWWIATQPYPEAHFALMPAELADLCVLAGTSERGCCARCGAPWTRQERELFRPQTDVSIERGIHPAWAGSQGMQNWAEVPRGTVRRETVGWLPSCDCGSGDTVPAVVLDPFGGAGTTGLVADRLRRDAILIELNPAYCAMIERRIVKDAGLFADLAAD